LKLQAIVETEFMIAGQSFPLNVNIGVVLAKPPNLVVFNRISILAWPAITSKISRPGPKLQDHLSPGVHVELLVDVL